jgi:hypothetical protein
MARVTGTLAGGGRSVSDHAWSHAGTFKEAMMRNTLLATVAAAALAAGTVMVSAQGMGGGAAGSPPSAAPPPSSAPAEKMERGKSDRGAQTPKAGERSTTGQTREPAERGQANPSSRESQSPRSGQSETQRGGAKDADTQRGATKDGDTKRGAASKDGDTKRGAASKDSDTQRGAASKDGDTQRGAASKDGDTQRGAASKDGASTSGSASLSTEQRTKIKQTVLRAGNAPKVSRTEINFNISVGTTVPRDRVRLVTVPSTIVEIHPAWRGYLYFVVEEEIIIVEPGSLRIVAVIA